MGRGKRLRCAPANSPITRGRGVRKPIDRLLWPLALGAWTYATGSPTPKGLGSCSERPAALLVYRGFDTPGRCVPVPPPSSVIPNAYGNAPSTGGVSSRTATAAHSPLPTTAACSCRNATLKIMCANAHAQGNQTSLRALPWRSARGFPTVFRAALVQTFASLVLRSCSGWEIPLPLRFAAPPSPGGVRHVGTCHAWHEKQRQPPRRKHPMNSTATTITVTPSTQNPNSRSHGKQRKR